MLAHSSSCASTAGCSSAAGLQQAAARAQVLCSMWHLLHGVEEADVLPVNLDHYRCVPRVRVLIVAVRRRIRSDGMILTKVDQRCSWHRMYLGPESHLRQVDPPRGDRDDLVPSLGKLDRQTTCNEVLGV